MKIRNVASKACFWVDCIGAAEVGCYILSHVLTIKSVTFIALTIES